MIDQSRIPGSLYSVELPAGTVTPVGPIRVSGLAPVTVTGLAVHPALGTLYGITSDTSPNHPLSLLRIDTKTASATVVGPLGAAGSDIAFDGDGTLFVWLRETSRIGTVDLASGVAKPMGPPRAASEPGGISIDAAGRVFLIGSGATGSVDRIDPASGTITRGATLTGAPFPAGINSITVAADGTLFAVNSNRGLPAKSALVRIDPESGGITRIGALPDDSDAIVFVHIPWDGAAFLASRSGVTLIAALLVIAAGVGFVMHARRHRGDA